MTTLFDNIQKIDSMQKAGIFKPYIKYIVFPAFKNFEKDAKVTFDFPITVLVGSNGTNKSSILKAMESCCPDEIISKRWFSTDIDAISHDPVPTFWYAYDLDQNKKTIEAQVLIAKYKREGDPDYWEAARPVVSIGMNKIPEDKKEKEFWGINTRWPKIIGKTPVYLTFRDSISAYDKFYHYGDTLSKYNKISDRKKFIRFKSKNLQKVIDRSLTTFKYYNVDKVLSNTELDKNGLEVISYILGIKYESIKIIYHSFFNCLGYTCKIEKNNINYSEAFAGSGEFAVIKIVAEILKCPNYSLILLDEPEVSLHPGAQDRLMQFLIEQTKIKFLQIVIATHSPAIIRNLPSNAIKVLNLSSNQVQIKDSGCQPSEAFWYIGEPLSSKKTIIVEDKLAQDLVNFSISDLDSSQKNLFEVRFYNGGAFDILNHFAVPYALSDNKNIYIYLDGDQRTDELPDPDTMTTNELINPKERLKKFCHGELKIPMNSRTTNQDKIDTHRKIISWLKNQVVFLPGNKNPEDFICEKATHPGLALIDPTIVDGKTRFEELTKKLMPDNYNITSENINFCQAMALNTIDKTDSDIKNISAQIKHIISTPSS